MQSVEGRGVLELSASLSLEMVALLIRHLS
jgi:hypothetical protein